MLRPSIEYYTSSDCTDDEEENVRGGGSGSASVRGGANFNNLKREYADAYDEALRALETLRTSYATNPNLAKCSYCPKLMPPSIMAAHVESEHEKCKHCVNRMPKKAMKAHVEKKHSDLVKCQFCPKSLSKAKLQVHMAQEHEKCKYCENYMKPSSMQAHIERAHANIVAVKCQYCSKSMPQSSIQKHINEKHMQKRKCRYCTKMMAHLDMKVLDRHVLQHESMHFVKCKHCGENVLESNLNSHIETKHKTHAIIGMIQLSKISDTKFNQMINEKRIYAKDGHLFMK